uniref:Uncharacterized protein n=1 Tax=Rhizophora mucronata TaxID=61149 RepID=A0A2P2QIZ3_RHIMU
MWESFIKRGLEQLYFTTSLTHNITQ